MSLHSDYDHMGYSIELINNLKIDNYKFVFMVDASVTTEKEILDKTYDIIFIG